MVVGALRNATSAIKLNFFSMKNEHAIHCEHLDS